MNEIEACISFIEHFLSEYGDNYVPFHSCPLKDAISEICFAPVRSRKIIALYLHNENDNFSKMFCTSLEEIKSVLDKAFYIIGWNINNETYHSALKKSLDDSINFEPAKILIEQKHSALLIIYPIENSITIFSILHGSKIKIKDVIIALQEIERSFETEVNDEIDLEDIQEQSQRLNDIGSREFQQLMHDRLANRDYDCFEYDEHAFLKDKIAFSKYGPPKSEDGYDKKQKKYIEDTYKQIYKFNNKFAEWKDQVVVSFVYNCLEPLPSEKLSRAKKYPDYNPKTDITPIPIYVVRKCIGSKNPCKIFIDNDNRAYNSWKTYIEDNKLHRCAMVLPDKGCYKNDEYNHVIIERHLSPSCGIGQIVLKGTDIATTLVGLASGGIIIAAMIPTIVVAPVALTVATATGIGVGIYSMIRSAVTIYDRHTHGESMSFANSGARGAYINIIAGSLGFVGAGATTAVTELASKGVDIGQGAQAALSTIRMMNISATGVNFANSTISVVDDWINEQEKPSHLTFLQLKSSLLFFTNYNFKSTVGELDEEIKTAELYNYQELLECNQRRKRKKSVANFLVSNEHDVEILPILTIHNTVEMFEIFQRNSELLPHNITFTFEDGNIFLNGKLVSLFSYLSRQLIDLPRTEPSSTETDSLVNKLEHIVLEYLSPSNANFTTTASVLLKGFHDTTLDNLLDIFKILIKTLDITLFHVCQAFTKEESLSAILEMFLGFLEFKTNEKEFNYIQEKQLAKQSNSYDEEEFHVKFKVPKDIKDRSLSWFEICIKQCAVDEMVQYVMSKLAEKIYSYCDNIEKRQKREECTSKNAFKVTCNVCGGYYFYKKSI